MKVKQESIGFLWGRLTYHLMGIKETISKVLDKNTSLAKKIRTLFREQAIMIVSILTAIGMTISVLVKALLLSGAAGSTLEPSVGKPKNAKEWLRNKLKALVRLLGKLGMKVAEALPGIIGAIISWILNRARK